MFTDYDDFTMRILKSTKSNKPKYSEIFMDTPFGSGVGRLAVDPFSYYVFTSDASEIAEIEDMVDGGVSYEDAIRDGQDFIASNAPHRTSMFSSVVNPVLSVSLPDTPVFPLTVV